MRKNVAIQHVSFNAVSTTDGSAVTTGTPTVYYTIDGGTQATGGGTCTHEGNGTWDYVPLQAETNGNHVSYTFVLAGAVNDLQNVYPVSFDPTDGVRIGLTALPNAAAEAAGGLYTRGSGAGQINQDANGRIDTNIAAISQDVAAADNLESQYDGTGLDGLTYPATQAQLSNIVAVGAATNTPAESYTLTTGTQSANTYVATATLDAVRHEHTDIAGAMELYYQFDIGNEGAPVSATMVGYLTSANDSLGVFAYNWGGASWDQIGILSGGPASDSTSTYALYAATHVGTGANQGKVRIRFYAASGLTTATLAVDQLYVSYAVVRQTVGYANGSFWINTVSGTAGTEAYFNGTADNPVDSLTDAQTLSATVPLTTYTVSNNSTIPLSAAFENSIMTGSGYTLALGGQSISGSRIEGAFVSGSATGASSVVFKDCVIGTSTLPVGAIMDSNIEGNITLGAAGEYHLHNSHCGNAAGVYFDFGAAVGDNQLLVHGWQGEIELRNMGQLGTDVAHLAGDGIFTIAATCTGGTVYYQGDWDFTDNSGGAVTLVKSDYNESIAAIKAKTDLLPTAAQWAYITAHAATAVPVTFTGGTTTTAVLGNVDGSAASATNDVYNGRVLIFTSGTLQYQATDITDYDGATKTATITAVTTAVTGTHTAILV